MEEILESGALGQTLAVPLTKDFLDGGRTAVAGVAAAQHGLDGHVPVGKDVAQLAGEDVLYGVDAVHRDNDVATVVVRGGVVVGLFDVGPAIAVEGATET